MSPSRPMNRAQKDAWFRQELLFDVLPRQPPGRGRVVDWDRLPGVLTDALPALELLSDTVVVSAPGNAERTWVYGRGEDDRLMIEVNASFAGHERAKDLLIARGVHTMHPGVPYQRGPEGLGQVAASSLSVKGRQVILWVFDNILTEVKDMGCEVEVEAIARQVQAFMERSVVSNLRGVLAGVRLVASAPRIDVGQTVDVHVELPAGSTRDSFVSTIATGDDGRLDLVSFDGFQAKLRAVAPGDSAVSARLADRRTLVSPDDLHAKVQIVSPAPRIVPSSGGGGG